MGEEYKWLLADRERLMLRMQGFASCGDREACVTVRRVRLAVGSRGRDQRPRRAEVKTFIAFGMPHDDIAALDTRGLRSQWSNQALMAVFRQLCDFGTERLRSRRSKASPDAEASARPLTFTSLLHDELIGRCTVPVMMTVARQLDGTVSSPVTWDRVRGQSVRRCDDDRRLSCGQARRPERAATGPSDVAVTAGRCRCR
jgi:hypothetical protein